MVPSPVAAIDDTTDERIAAIRRVEFPWADRENRIFLNHAATGPLPQRSVEALQTFVAACAQPWRLPAAAQIAALDRARTRCAALIGASAGEVALTVNTCFGLNLAAHSLPFEPGDIVVSSEREFPGNVYPWMAAGAERGIIHRRLPCIGRVLDEEAIHRALDEPRVRAVALSWVSFETGYRLDLRRLSEACRARGIWLVLDAIQGVGSAPLDVRDTPVDVLACGAPKWLLGPWGTGFVYVRDALIEQMAPNVVSWNAVRGSDDYTRLLDYDFTYWSDARRFETVTLPFQDFHALDASLSLFAEVGLATIEARVRSLTQVIVDWALSRRDVTLLTPAEPERHGGVISFIPPTPAENSARLLAAGVSHSLREGAIRLSPHFYNNEEEIRRALALLGE